MYFSVLYKKKIRTKVTTLFLLFSLTQAFAVEVPIYDFIIKPYTQDINVHFPPDSADATAPLLTEQYQAAQLQQFYTHYYASDAQGLSPWSEQMVNSIIPQVQKIELEIVDEFNNQDKSGTARHYAENFKEHDEVWLKKIQHNMGLAKLGSIEYKQEQRAIAINNTYARALPDSAPDFFHLSIPGQGFPFDNLQESTVWAGTPLYVFHVSHDKAWSLVLTPDAYFAWVKSSDIAFASPQFISQWQKAAQKGLIAVTKTDASIVDKHEHFQLTGYIGAVFPLAQHQDHTTAIFIPIKNKRHQASIKTALISTEASASMPLTATKMNLAKILKQLQNRPYGWGGAFFFNDCSQEIKSIFTPFGIWLPRNSSQQAKLSSVVDLSKNTVDERINNLKQNGHPLMTIIYINGHVMLYIGNREGANHDVEAMTYQNMWGLIPANGDKRYIVGQSVFLPLLKYFPENPDINSQANKPAFKLVYLDALAGKAPSPKAFTQYFIKPNMPVGL